MIATLKLHQTPPVQMCFQWIPSMKSGRSVACYSPRLRRTNWRGAFVSSGTCPLQNGSSSHTCYASRPRKTSISLRCCAEWWCPFWSEMANRIRTALSMQKKQAASFLALCAFPHIPALYQHSGLPSPLLCL
ncbi:hypothetical protein M9458_034993, partial [Cirrhinus mrigala]